MARILSSQLNRKDTVSPFIGAQILESLTTGMYDDPLMIYREYVQNSVDAIDVAIEQGILDTHEAYISINISGKDRKITIEDNGIGVPEVEAHKVLTDIGNSKKSGMALRGFRGIGRLGGIGYCKLLRFETRSSEQEPIAIVEWDASRLHQLLRDNRKEIALADAVQRVCTVRYQAPRAAPAHFFRVMLFGVRPFHEDVLVDVRAVRTYLSQVAPVPFDNRRFSFATYLRNYLKNVPDFREYDIRINDKKLFRPYQDDIVVFRNKWDRIMDVELFEFPDGNGRSFALGWYAKTALLGVLPKQSGMRSMRVRKGNIQIGNENFLDMSYTESRFARWHIGEIHVSDMCIKLNARRDGFEQSQEYERFLEYSYLFGEHLSEMCRKAAQERSNQRLAWKALKELECFTSSNRVFFDEEQIKKRNSRVQKIVDKIESILRKHSFPQEFIKRFTRAKHSNNCLKSPTSPIQYLDRRTLRYKEKEVLLYEICKQVFNCYSRIGSPYELIRTVIEPYLKPSIKKNLK